MATTEFTKIAWRRDRSVPPGQPARGHFDCPCGAKIEDVEYGAPGLVTCPRCETRYDKLGYKETD